MPWRVVRARFVLAERDRLAGGVEDVRRRRHLDVQAEHLGLLGGRVVQEEIFAMQVDGHAERALGGGDARHVIDVRVRQQDVADRQLPAHREVEQPLDLVAWIDQHRLAGGAARDDEAVLEEWANGLGLDYHHSLLCSGAPPPLPVPSRLTPLGIGLGRLSAQSAFRP